jgi:hypothetical protein
MTATMTSTAPTEEEIRAVLDAFRNHATDKSVSSNLEDFISALGTCLTYTGDSEEPDAGDIWRDLRLSEQARLEALVSKAIEAAVARAYEAAADEMVKAALRFAQEYPNAPRARA